MKVIGQCLLKQNIYILYDSAIPLPVIAQKKCAYMFTKIHAKE